MSHRFAPAKTALQPGTVPVPREAARRQVPAPSGNQALLRRLSRAAPNIQARLEIGPVDDPLEREADQAADSVMHMPGPARGFAQTPPAISRKATASEGETPLQTKPADTPITASPVKVSRDDDPDVAPAQMQDTKTDWTPPPPPTAPGEVNQVKAVDPRVFHDGKPTKFPGNPPPPTGWRYFNESKDGRPPARGVAISNQCMLAATPIGTFFQEILGDGRLIAVRCEWHDRHAGETDPSGLYKAGNIMLPVTAQKSMIQNKLEVSTPGDPLEREADRVADRVMRTAAGETEPGGPQPSQANATGTVAPPAVTSVLGAVGEPLQPSVRAHFEPRFGRDFSQVRLHTDGAAAHAARSIQARAFASGGDIVFASGAYAPATAEGQRLLAHELAHVVQQGAATSRNSAEPDRGGKAPATGLTETKDVSPNLIARAPASPTADPLKAGTTAGSGVQFWPIQLAGTYIGPVSGTGGVTATPDRLSAIVGPNLTLNALARSILPLWNAATPFTPDGAATPVVTADLTAEKLARGLLAYNQTYLRVLSQPAPSMTGFASGLRLPLPVQIDANQKGVVNKDLINQLAAGFDPAWVALLEQAATKTNGPGVTDLHQSVADFLVANLTADARGIALAVRAQTNALEARPFVLEAFAQLAADKFDVALAFVSNLVNTQISLLASQRDGAAILDSVRNAISVPPAAMSDAQQASLSRANLMLGSVATITPRAPPADRAVGIQEIDFTRYAGGGDIKGWITQACEAAGVPANDDWMNGLLSIAQRESTNDPNQVNTWDKNAVGPLAADGFKRNCSRGIAQVIPTTFIASHVAGTSWAIYDPVANFAASIQHIRQAYHVSADGSDLAKKVRQADPKRARLGY